MFDAFGSSRVYLFDPTMHLNYIKSLEKNPEFEDTLHIQFKNDVDLSAKDIADIFNQFGDFVVYKDTKNSCFIDWQYIDKKHIDG